MPKDALTSAIKEVLFPFLKHQGFTKSTAKKFIRERKSVFQHLWVDANGRSRTKSTRIVLCCTFPYATPNGYMDPHGFIACRGKHFDMSTNFAALKAMKEIVVELERSDLPALERIANMEYMLESLKAFDARPWFKLFSQLQEKWRQSDVELLKIAEENRRTLKL